jgi:integrase
VVFHTLRHTFAGVDLYTVSELLGNSDVKMTQRYAHLSPDHKRRAMEKLDGYFARQDEEKRQSVDSRSQ